MSNIMKDILAQAAFTAAVARLTKAAAKSGMDQDDISAVFYAVIQRSFPAKNDPAIPRLGPNAAPGK